MIARLWSRQLRVESPFAEMHEKGGGTFCLKCLLDTHMEVLIGKWSLSA